MKPQTIIQNIKECKTKMKAEKNTYQITPDEYPRIFGGVLSQADFDTTKPNPRNISKIAIGLEQYLSHKKKEAMKND